MIFWIVEDGKLRKWERSGKCNGCGECCHGYDITYKASVSVGEEEEGNEDYSRWDGWSAFKHHGVWWWMKVTGIEKDETKACECYEKGNCHVWMDEVEFPLLCRYFPVHPENLTEFKRCGFTFERRD